MTPPVNYGPIRGSSESSVSGTIESNLLHERNETLSCGRTLKGLQITMFCPLLTVIALMAFLLGIVMHPLSTLYSDSTVSECSLHTSTSASGKVPAFSIETKTFDFDMAFAADPSEAVDSAWLSLVPRGRGVIRLPDRNPNGTQIYNIAAYHNLHCLYMIRQSLFAFHQVSITPDLLDVEEASKMLEHGRHCIEYFRQMFLCNPELTLLPVEGNPMRLKKWTIARQCINYQQLVDWADSMRVGDAEGIV
ncbi:hypothetical protein F5Y18DRAFT_76727 [Xylariaceae sp. FL1019]|nr:hypothetical protein F5Y18DRAFT_76727 [Xylariaceae sp. FL1019]